jgi:hypothetical protein
MKIKRYNNFLNEEIINDTPKSYINIALKKIKSKIEKFFEYHEDDNSDESVEKSIEKAKEDAKDKSGVSLKDLGVRLESSEISKYSKLYDNLTMKFIDDNGWYNLYIAIDYKDALPEKDKEFTYKDIEKCFIKFKKYDIDTDEVIGQITKNIDISEIDENFLIDLKIEIDEEFGDDEEFEIETE